MKMAAVTSIDDYLNLYYGQLSSIGLPEDLYGRLYDKLFPEIVYDAGDAFVLHEKGSGSQGNPESTLLIQACFLGLEVKFTMLKV